MSTPDPYVSWLGRWNTQGWSIQVTPKLTNSEWGVWAEHADEAWNGEYYGYDAVLAMEVLKKCFPNHQTQVVMPACGHRTRFDREGRMPLYVECGKAGVHFSRMKDVMGDRVGIARCEDHKGMF